MPKLSIVIPTFNSVLSIENCLRSVACQSFRDYEVIVQDGGSSDGTVEKVRAFQRANATVKLAISIEKDRGPYDAMNKAVQRAAGEWLYFLGSDDELHDAEVLSAILGREDAASSDVVYGNVKVIGESDWAKQNPVYGGAFDLQRLLIGNICHQGIFYRAEFARRIGEYNIEYAIYADWDFNMRCWSETEFRYLDVLVANFRADGLSSSGQDERFKKDVASNVLRYFKLSARDSLLNTPQFIGFREIMDIRERDGAPRCAAATAAPSVSVIVPNYNHARFLRRRINSVLNQTFQNFELILLDDCSTDESRDVLSRYTNDPRVRIEFNEKNSGTPFKQWNKGVRMAKGKYVWIAESDDYADDRLLEHLVGVLESDEKISYAYCRSMSVTEDDEVRCWVRPDLPEPDRTRWLTDYQADGQEECRLYFVRTNVVPNASGVVFRKAVYEQVGGADETLRLCGDWKLWASLALAGRVAYVSDVLNYFRCHSASVRSQSERGARSLSETYQVMTWVLRQVPSAAPTVKKIRRDLASVWVPAVLSSHVSTDVKRSVMRELRLLDPFPYPRVIGPLILAAWLKIRRHWRELTARTPSAEEVSSIGK